MTKSQIIHDLKSALDGHQFQLYYQPKVHLASGHITGVEALIRWHHPTRGLIAPAEFIPIAEATDLIVPIGEWVLRHACTQSVAWRDAGLPPTIMAVNLAVRQLYQPRFVESVEGILRETGMDPTQLELEITEDMMMDVPRILPILKSLTHLGVRISLDDFGIGYSSLLNFKELPIDVIKIDRAFVNNCVVDRKDAAIVRTIIALAHELQVEVVAEGIESKDQLIFLQQHLCDRGQGYLFSKPVPPKDLVSTFGQIEEIIHREGIPPELSHQQRLKAVFHQTQQELADTLRHQQGMTFKFTRWDGRFIHTLCDGELLYRLGLTPEHVVGQELKDFLSPEEADRKTQYYRRAWEGEENVTYEGSHHGVWYVASLRPIRQGGHVVEVIGSCVDVTDRVEKEQEVAHLMDRLAQQEAQYRLIAEHSEDLIAILDRNGTIQYASPSHARILGRELSAFEGQSAFSLVHPDDISAIRRLWAEMISTNRTVCAEWRFPTLNGSLLWVEGIASPIVSPDGTVDRILVTSRDVTNRKTREEALRQSEDRYRRLVELSPEAIVVHADGQILFCNEAAVTMSGAATRADLIGRSVRDFTPFRDLDVASRIANTTGGTEPPIVALENRCIRLDGQELVIEATGAKIVYEGKSAVQYFIRDVTCRKDRGRTLRKQAVKRLNKRRRMRSLS
ncbi:EAL domain-containing protein [Sulfobacillus harzensis]|uniref:EAL domain-containing protein n=1 Tax=Sulfobacillus harzensis TaxID=2729629 RepID=A0A7Y0L7W3_9FIRM|nr:EAL domain-containing protein [Sulfobacillus harzensis]NMP24386.1 EAL domain-containing protein [Sulfobacillus harzensis]